MIALLQQADLQNVGRKYGMAELCDEKASENMVSAQPCFSRVITTNRAQERNWPKVLRDGKEVQIAVPTVVAGDIASWRDALHNLSLSSFSVVTAFRM